jgi:arylformamidase
MILKNLIHFLERVFDMKYLLLSHSINEHTPVYGDTPRPCILPLSQISRGDASNIVLLSIHNHTGTHIDAPKHFVDDGKAISEYSPDELIFKNPVIVNCLKNEESLITPDDLKPASQMLQKSDCLLLHTGFWKYRSEERYRTHNPGIAPETMLWIRKEYPNIRCIGIDSISVSSYQYRSIGREAHKAAFTVKEGVGEPLLLIEDMDLSKVSMDLNKISMDLNRVSMDLNMVSMDLNKVSCSKLKMVIVIPWQVNGIDSAPCSVLAKVE